MSNQLTDKKILTAIEMLIVQVGKRVEKYGYSPYPTMHDALGKMTEEYTEIIEAVRGENPERIAAEFLDAAVVSVITVASMVAGEEAEEAKTEQVDLNVPMEELTKAFGAEKRFE
jgi:NTP pyrophosphatase (non-canonical NTP hydrolase)